MIVIKLMGGLGNQMFQYSLGKKLARQYKTDLFLKTSFYKKNKIKVLLKIVISILTKHSLKEIKQNKRQYDLKYFNLDYAVKKNNKIKLPIIEEKNEFHFDENILKAGNNNEYSGYYNTEKYFIDIKEEIKKDFTLKKEYLDKLPKQIINKIDNTTSVSIHIRRGDYINNKTINSYHGVCDENYYIKAVNLIMVKLKNPTFFVFSDDINWCKKNLIFKTETFFISNLKNYEDLFLMSRCKHNIIANSTFSWWGAWLNNNINKIVIAPKRWLNNKNISETDLFPSNWITL